MSVTGVYRIDRKYRQMLQTEEQTNVTRLPLPCGEPCAWVGFWIRVDDSAGHMTCTNTQSDTHTHAHTRTHTHTAASPHLGVRLRARRLLRPLPAGLLDRPRE